MGELRLVFTDAKRVDSRPLNLIGVQPLRAVVARLLYRLRTTSHDPLAVELAREGYVIWEHFLPGDDFEATRHEAATYARETLPRWLHQQGTTLVTNYMLADVDPERFPHLASWHAGTRTLALARAAERRPLRPGAGNAMLEEVRHGDSSEPDPQNALHIDAVFNTHKIWLYLDDVTEENGPLVYVPRSHRLDLTRLLEEYRDSTAQGRCVDPSRRVDRDEVRRRRLQPRVLTCARNTLIIANTSGYHCRAPGRPGASRRALHLSFRFHPFRYPMPRTSRTVRAIARFVRPHAA